MSHMKLHRKLYEFVAGKLMLLTSLFSASVVILIGAALYLRARPLLAVRSWQQLLLSREWQPSAGLFGFRPFIEGTFWVTGLAVIIAVPVCLMAAVYLSEYASPRIRVVVKPMIDILAGIPSVVYGVWGVLVVVPFVANVLAPYASRHWHSIPFLSAEYSTGFSIFSGGVVLAVMISPVIVSVAAEVLRAVPVAYREASYAVGATRYETITRVVMRKALPGLVAAVVLGTSRALGETMAVLMVVGNVPQIAKSIFDPAYPLPALIANNYGEMMSIPLYDSALLAAALLLFGIILIFNILAQLALMQAVRRSTR
ncbi:MAG: phosphate ABC transporter permease subunit PstC [Armatimonadota bacterium]